MAFLETWKHRLTEPVYPDVGIEINSDGIRLAAVSARKGRVQVQHMDAMALPTDALQINPFKPNILAIEPVADALRDLWRRSRHHTPKICLLLQDRAALAFPVSLEAPPENREECLELIRFKLKKSVPFRIEDAHINYFRDNGEIDHRSSSFWVTVMNSHVLRQYEALVQSSIDAECGLVDLATFNLMNLADSEIRKQSWAGEDHLYINLNRNYISLAITQKDRLMFFRSREMERENGGIEEAMAEIHPAMMFYLDKLSGQHMSRAFVYSLNRPEELCRNLEETHKIKTVILNPDPTSRESKTFAPLLGLLMSRKVEAL
jgi:type IV pilus assembly protein PilM